jgi:hypothetical protein
MWGDLKACEGGILVRCLPPKLQMKLILDDVSNIPFYFRRIEPILPLLDENMLVPHPTRTHHSHTHTPTHTSVKLTPTCAMARPAGSGPHIRSSRRCRAEDLFGRCEVAAPPLVLQIPIRVRLLIRSRFKFIPTPLQV